MKIVKCASLLILAMISFLGVGACINNHSDRAEIDKALLEKKYKVEFTIFTSGEGYGSLTGNAYKVVAALTKDKSLKFEATAENKGAWMVHQYNQALLEKEIKNVVGDKLSGINNQFLVNVHVPRKERRCL
jgi:ABC-type glycerol-3-phosphate transport system substrate-binding protein